MGEGFALTTISEPPEASCTSDGTSSTITSGGTNSSSTSPDSDGTSTPDLDAGDQQPPPPLPLKATAPETTPPATSNASPQATATEKNSGDSKTKSPQPPKSKSPKPRKPPKTPAAPATSDKKSASTGHVYDTTAPPPGDCFNCGGPHWEIDCPRRTQGRVFTPPSSVVSRAHSHYHQAAGTHGEGYRYGPDLYVAKDSGLVHDTTAPPPGDCFNCGGPHWRIDCPRHIQGRVRTRAF